jgi:Fe-S oxidoreductase
MREGSLDAPTRHPIEWQTYAFWEEDSLNAELERVYDICHGCRRCVSLCDSFPTLFDLVDEGYDLVALIPSCVLMYKQELPLLYPYDPDVLNLVTDTHVNAIERCSGHDGTYAVKAETRDKSVKIARPVVRKVDEQAPAHLTSDCPMAAAQELPKRSMQ